MKDTIHRIIWTNAVSLFIYFCFRAILLHKTVITFKTENQLFSSVGEYVTNIISASVHACAATIS